MGEVARTESAVEPPFEEFSVESTALLDRVMPLPCLLCCIAVVVASRAPFETACLAAAFFGANLLLNAAIRYAGTHYRSLSSWLIGGGRLCVMMTFVPVIAYVAGPPFGWLLVVPAACVMPFYFVGWRAWAATALQCGASTLAFFAGGASVSEAFVAFAVATTLSFITTPITRALAAQIRHSRNAERVTSAFLANTSHEIRNPLNGVLGTLSLLSEQPLSDAQRQLVEISSRSAETLCSILNDILDLSKIEQGKLVIDPRPFDLLDAVKLLEREHHLLAEREGTRFNIDCAPDLPRVVVGDQLRLLQILRNFLSNAFKFARGTSVTLMVRRHEEHLELLVRDEGIGLSPEELARVFERFEQADGTTARRYGGTGLGLNIARHLAELMGGSIGAESDVGKGATFWLHIALAESSLPSSTPRARRASVPRSLRVLLVEDNETNRVVTKLMLEGEGCQVALACDGSEALEKFDVSSFDLLLMDCHMPQLDGYETTRRIRSRERVSKRRVPIVALTASVMASETARCREAGMDACLAKPLRRLELQAMLERVALGSIFELEGLRDEQAPRSEAGPRSEANAPASQNTRHRENMRSSEEVPGSKETLEREE